MNDYEYVQYFVLPDGQRVGVLVEGGPGLREVSSSPLDFTHISRTVSGIAKALKDCLNEAKPQKASIEFGLEFKLESDGIVALLCKGTGGATLKISLEYGDRAHGA